MRKKTVLKVVATAGSAIVLWNVIWFYSIRNMVCANFQGLSTNNPVLGDVEIDRHYLFSSADCESVGYDSTRVLDDVIKACHWYGRKVEIKVTLSSQLLTIRTEAVEKRDRNNYFGKDFNIGKNAVRSGIESVLFQNIETSGGYGMGLGLFNTISRASFGEHTFEYSVNETRYWLAFFLVPIVQKNSWSISLPAIHGQLTNEVQNGVSIARTYDSLNRPTGYTIMQNGGGNNPVNPVNPVEVNYSYDTLGRFSGVGFNAEAQRSRVDFDYSYLPGTDLVSGKSVLVGEGNSAFCILHSALSFEPSRNLIAAITNSFSPAGETYHLPLSTYHYSNDSLGRRTAITRFGAAFGDLSGVTDAYGYNLRSEVVSSRRTLDGAEVRGFDYDYAYDPIGNRTSATDYDEQGNALVSSYSANALNQYTHRTVPGYAAIRGEAATNATVTINERPVWRNGSYFYGGDEADNTASAVYKELEVYAAINPPGTNTPDVVYAFTSTVFIAKTPEQFTYDADGNMTSDCRFHYFL